MSNFEKLAAIDVSKHIEKKGNLSYLSWAWACDQLLRADPMANWVYNEPTIFPDGTMLVSCSVTAFEKTMTMHLPVMDYKNRAVSNPDAFSVNTAMMRCLVKCIALHGLGLYIYAGEDLPLSDEVKGTITKPTDNELFQPDDEQIKFMNEIVMDALDYAKDSYKDAAEYLESQKLDNDEKIWICDKLDSKTRSGIKKYNESIKLKEII